MPTLPGNSLSKLKIVETGTPLDRASGLGGLPRGFIVEFWGPSNTGKSTCAFQTVANAQSQGLRCLWVDVEHSFRGYAANTARSDAFGVDMDKLDVMVEATAEEYIDNVIEAIKEKKYDLIVMDSVGDLSSKIEQDKTAAEKTIGVQASLMTKFVRSVVWMVDAYDVLFIAVNHERETLMGGIYQMGGKKLKEKKKMSFRFRDDKGTGSGLLSNGTRPDGTPLIVGKKIRINVEKNHLAPTEGMEVKSNLFFQSGFDYVQDLFDMAVERNVITREGNTFYFDGEKLGTNQKAREAIKDPDFAEKVRAAIG